MSSSYTITAPAYLKLFFHVSKYPHQRVNGVLIGKGLADGSVEASDAIPLLHHWTSLSPMMEIGLDLAGEYAKSLGLQIVGYYQASERPSDTTLFPVGEKVASRIKQQFNNATAFVLDASKIGEELVPLVPYTSTGTANQAIWRPASSSSQPFTVGSNYQLSSPDLSAKVISLVRDSKLHFKFGDFDDHLEDVSIDWLRNRTCIPSDL